MSAPRGHTLRAPRRGDAAAAFELVAACELADVGAVLSMPRDVEHEWSVEGFDLARDAWVVEDGDARLVGAAWLDYGHKGAGVFVHPDACRRGIGTALREAVEARAREAFGPGVRLKQIVRGANDTARELLAAAGYEAAHRYTRMRVELEGPVEAPTPPAGVELRPMRRGVDDRAIYDVDTAAFGPSPDYEEGPFERFAADHLSWPSIVFDASPVAWEGDEVIGFALNELREGALGYVGILAVRPDRQRRGLGRALLLRSFADLAARGARRVELGVLGGNERAWRLYESAGMSAAHVVDRYEKRLG